MIRWAFLLTAAALFAPRPSFSTGTARGPHSEVSLLAETLSLRPGATVRLGLRFRLDKDWHIYWENPGDSGQAPQVQWRLPENFSAGPIEWPFPRRLEAPPLANFGYEGEVMFPVRLEVPKSAVAGGTARIEASLDWLICKVECLPASGVVRLALPVMLEAPRRDAGNAPLFARAAANLPGSFSQWHLRAEAGKSAVNLDIDGPAGRGPIQPVFFPEDGFTFDHAAPQPVAARGSSGIRLSLRLSDQVEAAPKILRGILVSQSGWDEKGSRLALAVDIPVQGEAAPLGRELGLAFLGGLLLNLMPCVFPVLSIKVLGFLGTGENGRRRQALLYAVGIVVSFWALAGVLLVLRAGGQKLGWGFQLQSPVFVAFLAGLMLLLGLNLLGIFEIGLSLTRLGGLTQASRGDWGAFASGALAVAVATPCTAPFMGTALAAALLRPAPQAMMIFTSLALGMAGPYVLLCWEPALLRFLPKPGRWMGTLKKAMSIPLFIAAAWLLWVFSRQMGLGLAPEARLDSAWQSYSASRFSDLRARGRPVFIDFTAAWCVTCQVNERLVLSRGDVLVKFKEMNVALLRADWTSHDPSITEALAALGRSGVPVYALYEAGQEARLLPTLLSASGLIAELEKTGQTKAK